MSKWSLASFSARNASVACFEFFPPCLSGCTIRLSFLNASPAAASPVPSEAMSPSFAGFSSQTSGSFLETRSQSFKGGTPSAIGRATSRRTANSESQSLPILPSPCVSATEHACPNSLSAVFATASPAGFPAVSTRNSSAIGRRNPAHTSHGAPGAGMPSSFPLPAALESPELDAYVPKPSTHLCTIDRSFRGLGCPVSFAARAVRAASSVTRFGHAKTLLTSAVAAATRRFANSSSSRFFAAAATSRATSFASFFSRKALHSWSSRCAPHKPPTKTIPATAAKQSKTTQKTPPKRVNLRRCGFRFDGDVGMPCGTVGGKGWRYGWSVRFWLPTWEVPLLSVLIGESDPNDEAGVFLPPPNNRATSRCPYATAKSHAVFPRESADPGVRAFLFAPASSNRLTTSTRP
mmetsp:Transcript_13230/g.49461  ORF Transcript_13230/g.49461 Transcript_13230/m.49461 type:complete len:407 (-) Transcript_13230:1435-2655(-)